jgi:hypothetical protein
MHNWVRYTAERVEFVNDRIRYILLRGHWGDTSILNLGTATKNKSDDKNIRFC